MLSEPFAGWSNIKIEEWQDRCSYLDDVPMMLLEGVLSVLRTKKPYCIKLDAEGYYYKIVFDNHETDIITYRDDVYMTHVE